jgi:membrane associated rhomboid family serine protease/predicted Zn-dependent protease
MAAESPDPGVSGNAVPPPEPEPDYTAPTVTYAEELTPIWVTPAIVVLNVVVFVAMLATGVSPISPTAGDLFKWGANFGPATFLGGEWWRLLTCAFVHVGVLHLVFNMYALWAAGAWAERVFGSVAFLGLYLVAAVGGSLVSTLWSPEVVSAGASGAIFGVYGAILAFVQVQGGHLPEGAAEHLRRSSLGFVAYNLLFGLTAPNISNSAHVGGLATGFLAGWLLTRDLQVRAAGETTHYLRLAGVLPLLAALAWGTHARISGLPTVRARRLAQEAVTAMNEKDLPKARRQLDEAIGIDPRNGWLFLYRGQVRETAGDREGAISDYGEAISRDPKAAVPLAMRCMALCRKGDYDHATKDCDAALALDASNREAWHGRAHILSAKGLREEAAKAAGRFTQLAPDHAYGCVLLAELLIEKGDLAAAEREIRKASDSAPEEPSVVWARTNLMLRRADYTNAQKELDHLILLRPKDAWVYSARARVFRAQGNLRQALADADRAVELDPNNGDWHNGRAWTLLQFGRLRDGLAAIERSLALKPNSPHALGTRCWLRVSLGDRTGGKADCERAVTLWPAADVAGPEVDRGMLAFLEGRYADAATAWRRGSAKEPSEAAFLDTWIAKAEFAGRRASKVR